MNLCYSDIFQDELIKKINNTQLKKLNSENFCTIDATGQIYEKEFEKTFLKSSTEISELLDSIEPLQIKNTTGFITYDGKFLNSSNIDLSSKKALDNIVELDSHFLKKLNNSSPSFCVSFENEISPSHYVLNDDFESSRNLWSSEKVTKLDPTTEISNLAKIPNLFINGKVDKQKLSKNLFVDSNFNGINNVMYKSSQISSFLIPEKNTIHKETSQEFPLFNDNGYIKTYGTFPQPHFYEKIELPDINPNDFQSIPKLSSNAFVDGCLSSKDIYSAKNYVSETYLKPTGAKVNSFMDKQSNTFNDFLKADELKFLIDKKICGSIIFSKIVNNTVLFDFVEGNINQVDSSTLILNGKFFLELHLDFEKDSIITIFDEPCMVNSGIFHYTKLFTHSGKWNLNISTFENNLKTGKCILIQK